MTRDKGILSRKIKSIGGRYDKKDLYKEVSEKEGVSEQIVEDVMKTFVSHKFLYPTLRRGDMIDIPGCLKIYMPKNKVVIPNTTYQRVKKWRNKNERNRLLHNMYRYKNMKKRRAQKRYIKKYRLKLRKKRLNELRYHNMWREINKLPPKTKLLRKSSELYASMPKSKNRITRTYNILFKTNSK